MGKSNVAESTANVAAEVAEVKTVEVVAAPVMTVVKNEIEEPRRLTLDEKIQRVEDLTMLIDRWRTLNESRRKLQTFHIGADSMSSTILLRDSAGNEFKTSNSRVYILFIWPRGTPIQLLCTPELFLYSMVVSSVITSVIDEMKRTLDGKVKEVEEQISL